MCVPPFLQHESALIIDKKCQLGHIAVVMRQMHYQCQGGGDDQDQR